MLTKSKIQLIREGLETLNDFRIGLENLMEKYKIQDSIFGYSNNGVYEVSNGYFEILQEYDNIKDAVRECYNSLDKKAIRIINNNKFEVGEIHMLRSECGEGKVLNILK